MTAAGFTELCVDIVILQTTDGVDTFLFAPARVISLVTIPVGIAMIA